MRKKERVVGTEQFYNRSTGELVNMQIVESDDYDKDYNFHKIFLKNFMDALDEIVNQKTALCFWILSNLTKDNKLLYTYRQISEKSGYSYKTVADTMRYLIDKDFLCRIGTGRYMVNPKIIFKGSYQRRCIALSQYGEVESERKMTSEKLRLQAIQKQINRLQKQEKGLKKILEIEEESGKEQAEKKKEEETK